MADIVAKDFLAWRTKLSRGGDAFRVRRYEGPHRFTQKRPRSFVSALRSIALAESAKNQLLRDFQRRSIFDFCNKICQERNAARIRQLTAALEAWTSILRF